jgi:CDP-diacylglycerol--glycerol-3-phosphate 3-phosphatidyltransferase
MDWNGYATGWARLHGGFDPRRAGPFVRGWLRLSYGLGKGLSRIGTAPSAVTTIGLLLCLSAPIATELGRGWPVVVAGVLVLLAAVADSVDGAVAVVSGRTSRLGYVYDSLADRIGEAAWLAAFWVIGAPGLLVVTAAGMSWLHEYTRARASVAGMRNIGAVTVGERPVRGGRPGVAGPAGRHGDRRGGDLGAARRGRLHPALLGGPGRAQLTPATRRRDRSPDKTGD